MKNKTKLVWFSGSLSNILKDVKFVVNGGKRLEGEVEVRGFKNAATPILAATLLTERPCVIKNLPLIGDVLNFIGIIESIGSKVEWLDARTVRITNDNIDPSKLNKDLVCKMRSSILLLGPILSRFGSIEMKTPGGCHIGVRPMDVHFDAFKTLGFDVKYDEADDVYSLNRTGDVKSSEVVLSEFSVTATENILMFGALNPGLTIKIAALEPHIEDLSKFLWALGAKISGIGTHTLYVEKGLETGGEVEHVIMNDPIEAGTFMALGFTTKSDIVISGAPVETLTLPLLKFKEMGCSFSVEGNKIVVEGSKSNLVATKKIEVRPYPGFPSDLQAPFGVLATQAEGETMIFDTLYEGRLKYLYELEKMGATIEILDPHRGIIKGPTKLVGTEVESIDLRAGATLIIAALAAEGRTVLNNAEQIDRGYEKIEERLAKIGAEIERIK